MVRKFPEFSRFSLIFFKKVPFSRFSLSSTNPVIHEWFVPFSQMSNCSLVNFKTGITQLAQAALIY